MRGLLQRLATVCRDCRKANGQTQIQVATEARVSHTTISRFERVEGWPKHLEEVIEGYAVVCDTDAAELWRRAIE